MHDDTPYPRPSRPAARTIWLPWRLLLRLRWKLAVLLVVVFVLGQIIAGVWTEEPLAWLLFDVLGWGAISGLTIWLSVVWASRREQRHQADLQAALRRQQELNRKLQRANSHLELLSQTNEHIAGSSTLDEILVSALLFPQRLVPAQAAALLLIDASGAIEIRSEGASSDDLARLRECFGIMPQVAERPGPRMLVQHAGTQPGCAMSACLVLPLHDGLAPLGWIELYLAHPPAIPDDELALLETIAREVAEAIISARRRSHEERAIYELERAIADERARIARDIHDGLAQSLAFVRMRVDLWQDWVEGDPQRLHDELAELKHTLRGQIRELRRAIFALRPLQFDELGFVGGLRRYIVEFSEQQAWDTHIDLKGAPPTLSLELEAVCFRIVQEALTNVAKHAAANRVEVTIDQIDRGMRVIVRDDGHGFEPSILSEGGPPGHVGLRQMYERLAAFRGQLTLLSRPGAGTELRVWIPLLQESTILSPHQAERA